MADAMRLTRYRFTPGDGITRYDYAMLENSDGEYLKADEVRAVLTQVTKQLTILKDYTYLNAEPPELRAQNERAHRIASELLTSLQEMLP